MIFQDSKEIDAMDERIIAALQSNGRLSYEELGERVGLSASAALRRVKKLEGSGVIAGYAALVNAHKVGLGLTAYINVRLAKHSPGDKRHPMDVFVAAVQTWPEVQECASLTGDMDYLLKVLVADMDAYTRFVMNTLLRHPSVQECRSSFVMRVFKSTPMQV